MNDTSIKITSKIYKQRIIPLFICHRLPLIIIGFGLLVRLIPYLYNRSLWADEAVLALNIINRSYIELLQPLDYDQGAPIGFLVVEKLAVQIFGNNEYALRLFPLVSGILSLFLFYKLAKKTISRIAIPIALTLFSSLHYLVYYASEVKQYSTDVALALFSCLLAMQLRSKKLDVRQLVTYSLLGAIAIWFSHPAILVLLGVGLISLLFSIRQKNPNKIYRILLIQLVWLLSFSIFYFISLRHLGANEDLLTSWKDAFPSSLFNIIWGLDAFGKLFYKPLGFNGPIDGLAIFAFVIGCVSYFRCNKKGLLILLSPLFVTFSAAYLHKYPFQSRLVLFLTPFIILLIAEGVDYLLRKTRPKPIIILGNLLLVLLIAPPLVSASSNFLFKPYLREEIKPVISYVKNFEQPGDIIYVFQRGEYQFKYYAEKYGYQVGDYIIGVDDLDQIDGNRSLTDAERERYKSDLDKLRGNKRVWLIFSHATVNSENEMIKSYLDSIGKQVDFFESPGAFVYMYDLS